VDDDEYVPHFLERSDPEFLDELRQEFRRLSEHPGYIDAVGLRPKSGRDVGAMRLAWLDRENKIRAMVLWFPPGHLPSLIKDLKQMRRLIRRDRWRQQVRRALHRNK
jgi:hypothetical protein